MATSRVLIWSKSVLCTVSCLSCHWTRQFCRTEIQHSSGLPLSFRAEGHDKRNTEFHVLRRQTFVDPRSFLLEFKISRAKRSMCQTHGVFPTADEVQHRGASRRHHNLSVPVLQMFFLFCPPARQLYRTDSLLPPRSPVRSATLGHSAA